MKTLITAAIVLTSLTPELPAALRTDFTMKAAFLDAASNALSQRMTGEDFQQFQRRRLGLQPGEVADPYAHGAFALKPLCAQASADDWLALNCHWMTAAPSPAECINGPCLEIHLAPFVTQDAALLKTVTEALQAPCRHLPDPAVLNDALRLPKVHSPGSFMPLEVSRYWLGCGSGREESAGIHPVKGDIFRISY